MLSYINNRLSNQQTGRFYLIEEIDPFEEDLKPYCSEQQADHVFKYKYAWVLWKNRNCYIHAFQPPQENGMELSSKYANTVHYHLSRTLPLDNSDDNEEPEWKLVVPSGFLFNLANKCCEGVIHHFKEHSINPYKKVKSDSVIK